jgi:hypothetical protein
VPLKEKCVEFICTDESWKAPHIASKLSALPIGKHASPRTSHHPASSSAQLRVRVRACVWTEVIERILLYLHRTERLTLEALEFFKAFPVETLFLSNIRVCPLPGTIRFEVVLAHSRAFLRVFFFPRE